MRFLEEILYLSSLSGIGRGILNREYVPWRYWRDEDSDTRVRRITDMEPDFTMPEEWLRLTGRILSAEDDKTAKQKTEKVWEWLEKHQETNVCTVFDRDYPSQLRVMGNQRPLAVYYQGCLTNVCNRIALSESDPDKVSILSLPSLAVIGSRWPGEYTLRNGPVFARVLAERTGMAIVSGLARGCDRMGHRAAMDAGIPTVAVMPCGLDTIVPDINRDIADEILDGCGLLISEYPPGTLPADYQYVERDRITAALSSATVVIECGIKSGTMQTVNAALSYGKPVACWFPESVGNQGFEGNRYMLEQLDACRITETASIDELLNRIELKEKEMMEEPEQMRLF